MLCFRLIFPYSVLCPLHSSSPSPLTHTPGLGQCARPVGGRPEGLPDRHELGQDLLRRRDLRHSEGARAAALGDSDQPKARARLDCDRASGGGGRQDGRRALVDGEGLRDVSGQ